MRRAVTALALTALLLLLTFPAPAQQAKKIPRIGYLSPASAASQQGRIAAFRQGLAQAGYVEGKNVLVEYEFADGKLDRLPQLATKLGTLKVDVIVTASDPGVSAAKRATQTVPIVFAATSDPVESGFVNSLARPGGNATGLAILYTELSGKRLELLKETFPNLARIAILFGDPSESGDALKQMKIVAQALQVELQPLPVRTPNDFELAFQAAIRERAQGLLANPSSIINTARQRILDFAAKNRLPAMYAGPEFVEAGGLMSYAPNYTDLFRRTAMYVDKIMKGAKPADLPVEQPNKFEFIINFKTANQTALAIPGNVLSRADKVIK
jgi:putative ABC transport system substrate-binding protein